MPRAVRRFAAIVAFAFAGQVHAFNWTALWWNPAESGWGVTITQQYDVIVLTFLLYGEDRMPHWYEAAAYPGSTPQTGYAAWSGDVYESTGPYFGGPFNPATVTSRKVGTMTFAPSTPGTATLTYSIDGVAVTKPIERQTFQRIPLLGAFRGVYRVDESNCAGHGEGDHGNIQFATKVATNPDKVSGTLTAFITFDDSPSCTFQGSFRQYGTIFEFSNVNACGSRMWAASFTDLDAALENMQGHMSAQGAGGCQTRLSISVQRQ